MLNFRVMTLDQLLALVNDDFYKNVTSKAELEAYSKNVYHKACLADGDFNNPSQFYIRSFQERAFGLFDHIHNIIYINQILFDLFEKSKQENNIFLPYILTQTLVHEARHFSQNNQKSSVDGYLKKFAFCTKVFKGFDSDIASDTNPLEVDARAHTFTILQRYPSMQRFQNHQNYLKTEIRRKRGYSSIFASVFKTMLKQQLYQGPRNDYLDSQLEKLKQSCIEFLENHSIDTDEFSKSIMQYAINQRLVRCYSKRPTEDRLIETESHPLVQALEDKIYYDGIIDDSSLLKCHDKIYSLNIRPAIQDYAYYSIKLNAFRALETKELYDTYAPQFRDFESKVASAPLPLEEEVTFMREFRELSAK